ncbi:MAG: TonB-dependent receptor domain-containing protein [Candidatus Polarisedimenticolia bacterium]
MKRALIAALLLAAGALQAAAQDPPAGIIRGTVIDREFATPVSGARVSVLGLPAAVLSSPDGTFLLRGIPVGAWTLTISKAGYETALLTDVAVAPGGFTDVRADLAQEVLEIEEMVVTGADALVDSEVGLLELRAAAVSVQDAVSSELISKAGVSDAAGALKLVVGASVQGGKYATVRGLSDRYTGTTLNGVRVPSADPRRRSVQLDLFPAGTLEGVTVTKSFTPDLQGDFTGGGIDIRTKSIPEGPVLSFSTSFEHNSLATGNGGFLTYGGGGVSALARHGGDRDLPAPATAPLPALPRFWTGATPGTPDYQASVAHDGMVRSFEPAMGVDESAPGLNNGLSLAAGDRYEFGDGRVLGMMSGLTYARKFDAYEAGVNNTGGVSDASQPVNLGRRRADSRGIEEVLLGALANLVLVPQEGHELALRAVVNQSAEDEARFQEEDQGPGTVEQNQSLHYTERSLVSFQLHGAHATPGDRRPRVDWMASVNRTDQVEPDVRFFRNRSYVLDETLGLYAADFSFPGGSTPQQNSRRIFREIDEDNLQGAVHATLPFGRGRGLEGFFKTGLYADRTDRAYFQRSFFYEFATQAGSRDAVWARNQSYSFFSTSEPDRLWTDVFLDPERIGLADAIPRNGAPNQLLWTLQPSGDDVDYGGEQAIGALYAMAEVPLRHDLKVVAGVRREDTRLEITPSPASASNTLKVIEVQPGEDGEPGDRAIVDATSEEARAAIRATRHLPSLSVVWEPAIRMNVRLSWSRTLARPTFRELAPVVTEEFIFGDEFIGNPGLALSRITNFDLRWEWFRRSGDVLAASVFYKDLRDPIEYISYSVSGRSFVQPLNYERGWVRGLEVEARLGLDLFSERLRRFAVGVNATWLDSEVEVPAAERKSLADFGLAESTRRLQGQPEYVYNLNVTWDDEARGLGAAIFYNRVGETLLTGAARGEADGIPNVFDAAYGSLDLTAGKRLTDHLSIGLKARNVLRAVRTSVYRQPDGREAIKSERETAALYAISASYRW